MKAFSSLRIFESNRIYLLRNFFSNYAYLKDKYITLKKIRKILFVLVLRIFSIYKFLNFTTIVSKNLNTPEFVYNFAREKVNFSLRHAIYIIIHSF